AREDGQANDVGILLQRRVHDLFGRLAQPRVDDLHAGIAERTGNHLGATVVAVEPRRGDDDPDSSHITLDGDPTYRALFGVLRAWFVFGVRVVFRFRFRFRFVNAGPPCTVNAGRG